MLKYDLERALTAPPMPPVYAYNIPQLMRNSATWIAWQYFWVKPTKTREGKWTKKPLCRGQNSDGKDRWFAAKSNDPSTWTDFESIISDVLLGREFAYLLGCEPKTGVGFVCDKDRNGVTGIDLDHSVEYGTGRVLPWAQELVARFSAYTEYSPSGTGLKIYLRGVKPGNRSRTELHPALHLRKVEIYNHVRFLAITGHHLPGTPTEIVDRQAELNSLYDEMFPARERTASITVPGLDLPAVAPVKSSPLACTSDVELIEKAMNSQNGDKFRALWEGDWSDYESRSSADFALAGSLAFWCGPDAARIESLMMQSGLRRSKWSESRQGGTYLTVTINNALRGQSNHYGDGRLRSRTSAEFAYMDGIDLTFAPPRKRGSGSSRVAGSSVDVLAFTAATMGNPPPAPPVLSSRDRVAAFFAGSNWNAPVPEESLNAKIIRTHGLTDSQEITSVPEWSDNGPGSNHSPFKKTNALRWNNPCPRCRRPMLGTEADLFIPIIHCGCWHCEVCGPIKQQEQIENLALHVSHLERVYVVRELPRELWPAMAERLRLDRSNHTVELPDGSERAARGNYVSLRPDGCDGFAPMFVVSDSPKLASNQARGRFAVLEMTPADACELFATEIAGCHYDRPTTHSAAWKVPEPPKRPARATRYGMVNELVTEEMIREYVERRGTSCEAKSPPHKYRFTWHYVLSIDWSGWTRLEKIRFVEFLKTGITHEEWEDFKAEERCRRDARRQEVAATFSPSGSTQETDLREFEEESGSEHSYR